MRFRTIAAVIVALGAVGPAVIGAALGQTAHDATAEGKAVYQRANCVGCHKWHGNGGGGYGGEALSLRRTMLGRDQIIETVSCGRPGTGMPFHIRGAYDSMTCYALSRSELAGMMPPEATGFLRPSEIAAVADYVLAHVKGRGEPDYADCIEFFGAGSRVCNIYRPDKPATATPGG